MFLCSHKIHLLTTRQDFPSLSGPCFHPRSLRSTYIIIHFITYKGNISCQLLLNLIQNINALASTIDKGTKFEALCLYFLRYDKFFKSRLSDLWLWNDWPEHNTHDTGIDIVAKLRDSDKYCAVQCKFRDEGVAINK